MEEKINIQSIRWYPTATSSQIAELMDAMSREDSKELLLLPDPSDPDFYRGILLSKYYTPVLSQLVGVRAAVQESRFSFLLVSRLSHRGFLSALLRKLQFQPSEEPAADTAQEANDQPPSEYDPRFLDNPAATEFLKTKTPAQIENELNEHIIGQPALTRAVADFLYYHALRQIHPELPQRPLLIAGPSGSGKTEVWRVASRLYGSTFPIQIVDGSNMTCDGWAGNYKLDTYIDRQLVNGGILVVDEFDKLTRPKHSAHGSNVSLDMQAEFLKLIEGEYQVTEKKKQTGLTSKKMGFVLAGAFDSLRQSKEARKTRATAHIGFCTDRTNGPNPAVQDCEALTDEDFIAYGIMPEIVGRIAAKCSTVPLTEQNYLDIIRGPHSRVALMERILKQYGADISDVISTEELREMVAATRSNRTGVRWVAAQVENRLLEAIRQQGLLHDRAKAS